MPVEFRLPELGENVEKGDVVRVLVNVGDVVAQDQPVLELETDKATIEVPSSVAGRVTEVRVKPGDKVKVGQAVLALDADTGAAAETAPPAQAANAAAVDAPPAPAPAPAQPAAAAAPPPQAVAPADEAEPARPAARASVVDIMSARPAAPAERPEGPTLVPAAPSVRRYARELGVDIAQVSGSGPGGRIGQQDVRQHVREVFANGGPARAAALPDLGKWGEIEIVPMSNIRRKTAEHLSIGWQAPHVTQHDKADMTALETFRKHFGPRVEKAGAKLTVTVALVKIVAAALDRFPQFASSVDMARQSIVLRKYRHVGVAVDTPNGLLVPVIRDVNHKGLIEIAVELTDLAQRAQQKKLGLDEMSGGVFSVSNLGGLGGTAFTPLVNHPEVAILGVSRGSIEPVWQDGQFVPRQMMPLSLSYDHRVIDGADAVRFLRFIVEAIEQPLSMLL
ncbi:MAG: 2-oxo acid dehydrogenase subunit E2 [Acidobacteria bacterium]|nr:2-oxo acid dehydrogenase subunit E2 [Acidobacteriota bacterium]